MSRVTGAVTEIGTLLTSQLAPELAAWKRRQQLACLGGPQLTGEERLQCWYYLNAAACSWNRTGLGREPTGTPLSRQVHVYAAEPVSPQEAAGQTGAADPESDLWERPHPSPETPAG